MATVLAQSVLSLVAGYFTCRHLKIGWLPWVLKGWAFPVAGIVFAAWLRCLYAALLAVAAWALGVRLDYIKEELQLFSKFFRK
jgi:hypothetical protein